MSLLRLLLAAWLLLCGSAASAQELRVHFFDVGQGDAVLIQSPSGQNVLYDGGEFGDVTLARLDAAGVTSLDLVIASHNHADHIGGLPTVIRHYRPRFYLDNNVPATTRAYQHVLDAVRAAGSELLEASGQRITLGPVTLRILSPPRLAAWEQNDNSVGVVVEFGVFRLSLGGDAENRLWQWWTTEFPDAVSKVQVHKASHHGSANGDSAAAMSRLSPEVVVVSAGLRNQYGHPHPEALHLYAAHGATVYQSAVDGTVIVQAQESGQYSVFLAGGEGARPPTATPVTAATLPVALPPSGTPRARCIDLNSASVADLQRLIHIGPARAQQIAELRAIRPFRSVQEITRVNGIAAARLRDIVAEGLACALWQP